MSLPAAITVLVAFATQSFGQPAVTPYSVMRMADGKQWTTRNLALNTLPSYCYGASQDNCLRYGRLYTWESARRACESLGAGWSLPTDADWRRLARQYGGVSADSNDRGNGAFKALVHGGSGQFGALLGGGRSGDGRYARVEAHGFYWTASDNDGGTATFYNFAKGSAGLHRQSGGEKDQAFSVRCIRK